MTTTETHTHPQPRLDPFGLAGSVAAAMARVEERIKLDPALRELIKLRASQINGCAYCLDMHWADAKAAGESDVRLAQLSAHAESPYFDARERAVLALTDAVTLVAETQVPDEVWDRAAQQLDEVELANVLLQIAAINFWNRVAVASRLVPASWTAA
ncbi:carboxymuconolactone decarboxylase family protein [Paraconexibacter antarcticus]|uniref:Carboxymuconolactone decarboxylase family protein n=1 Tax=Paraconexibacter antarcticus TaxID=2949664 RepID=A0ABY5DWL5_9ACTN|nr:carboxymuconolactone decarboxylase family protein [Paraconexibacter antarcticus]UTI65324.1 carboxymuconolactone decarboxylase family protein [Paraconexibacter antarcticus]